MSEARKHRVSVSDFALAMGVELEEDLEARRAAPAQGAIRLNAWGFIYGNWFQRRFGRVG